MIPFDAVCEAVRAIHLHTASRGIWVRFNHSDNTLDVYFDADESFSGERIEETLFRAETVCDIHIRNIRECFISESSTICDTLCWCRNVDPGHEIYRIYTALDKCRISLTRFRDLCLHIENKDEHFASDAIENLYDDCARERYRIMIWQAASMIMEFLNFHGESIPSPRDAVSRSMFEKHYGGNGEIWAEMMYVFDLLEEHKDGIPFYELFINWKEYIKAVENSYNHFSAITSGYAGYTQDRPTDTPKKGEYVRAQNVQDCFAGIIVADAEEYRDSIEAAKRALFSEARQESEELYLKFKQEYEDL